MKHEDLIKGSAKLGFQLPEAKKAGDANRTLAEAILSRDPRFWAAFPAMVANAAEEGEFNPEAVVAYLQGHERDSFRALMLTSAALYRHLNLRFRWAKEAVAGFGRGTLTGYLDRFQKGGEIRIGEESLSTEEISDCFLASFRKSEQRLKKAETVREQLGLEYALARIFPPAQKQLFMKKLRGEAMTKTEREYFSRVVRKKAQALANEDLHRMAIKALE
ncbi:MAG TPA: hypothetical protein DCZ92_15245 [Elusimicrobia bacterium]|nr:MAG: hypothetical protein A2016_03170 [Elusimicrobia bacterium GWF2_62_30]HBA62136.1 hypothetical protein [Elusimicrobiota bacterium]